MAAISLSSLKQTGLTPGSRRKKERKEGVGNGVSVSSKARLLTLILKEEISE